MESKNQSEEEAEQKRLVGAESISTVARGEGLGAGWMRR